MVQFQNMTLRNALLFVLLVLTCANAKLALAANSEPQTNTRKEFVSACIEAFKASSESKGSDPNGIGQRICDCTVKESQHQGTTPDALKTETGRIKADPKYRIRDPKLLAAFQYCTIETLREE
jgi:hypothetical protein